MAALQAGRAGEKDSASLTNSPSVLGTFRRRTQRLVTSLHVAVTGASGFLGKSLVPHLLASGHEVTALTRRRDSSGVSSAVSVAIEFPGTPEEIARAVVGCDAVIHLAAAGVSPRTSGRDDLEAVNVEGMRTLLRGVAMSRVPHVVVAGTWAEYGRTLDMTCPIPPSAELRPVTDYAVSKARAFSIAQSGAFGPGVGVSYVRIFNAFGPHQNPASLWPSLRAAAMTGLDLHLSSGGQIRDFIPVDGVVRHLATKLVHPAAPGTIEISNCGTGAGQSVKDFAEHWWATWRAEGSLIFGEIEQRSWDPVCSIAGVSSRCVIPRSTASLNLPSYGRY